ARSGWARYAATPPAACYRSGQGYRRTAWAPSGRGQSCKVTGHRCERRGRPRCWRSHAAGKRGQDRHDITVLQLGVELAEIADVLVVQVDVDEAMQLAVLHHIGFDARIGGIEVVEQRADRAAAT